MVRAMRGLQGTQQLCGKCSPCRGMPAFGGSGRQKKSCVRRRCRGLGEQVVKAASGVVGGRPGKERVGEKPRVEWEDFSSQDDDFRVG